MSPHEDVQEAQQAEVAPLRWFNSPCQLNMFLFTNQNLVCLVRTLPDGLPIHVP